MSQKLRCMYFWAHPFQKKKKKKKGQVQKCCAFSKPTIITDQTNKYVAKESVLNYLLIRKVFEEIQNPHLIFLKSTWAFEMYHSLREYCTSYQKLACFVHYLKIINTMKITYASQSKLFKELQNGIEILVGQAVFKL